MKTLLVIVLVISGMVFSACVLLMNPKGGLGSLMGGFSGGNNEYGSKKSMEGSLKKAAIVSFSVFLVSSIALPFSS